MLTVFVPPLPSRRETVRTGKHFGSVSLHRKTRSHQDKPNPIPRLRVEMEILHTDRFTDRCSWNTPTSTPALRDIPSLRCQESRSSLPTAETFTLRAWMQKAGGASRDRTDDLKLAKLALSQLSYGPGPLLTATKAAEANKPSGPSRASGGPGKI